MKKTIPQREIVNCDVCQKECTEYDRKQGGVIKVEQAALDWNGDPCANGNISFDLCDCCLNHLIKTLNSEIEHIREITDATKSV